MPVFADIRPGFAPRMERLDHRCLNDVPGLEKPTSENLAIRIWNELETLLPILSKVAVREARTSGCADEGPE